VFYYTGHGGQLPQDDASEGEQFDQCFCLVDADGNTDDPTMQYRKKAWMRDGTFAKAVLDALLPSVKVLVLVDCCHSGTQSGTICDFTVKSEWVKRRHRAISISSYEDTQTSAGAGKGGMLTRALTRAVQDLQGRGTYNVSTIYNLTLKHYKGAKNPGGTENMSMFCKWRSQMAWPLQPKTQYFSPANVEGKSVSPGTS